jgi:hypothetical protein
VVADAELRRLVSGGAVTQVYTYIYMCM